MLKIPDVHFVKPPFPGLRTSEVMCGEKVHIKYSDNLGKDRECYGIMILEDRLIVLDANGDREHIEMTTTHELLHFAAGLSGAHCLNGEQEEQWVRAITPFVHSLLKSKKQ